MVVPLFVGREKSVAALEAAMAADKELFLVAQLDPGEDDPDRDALYDLGVVATAMQLLKLPDGTVRVLVEGQRRARLDRSTWRPATALLVARGRGSSGERPTAPEVSAMMRTVVEQVGEYAKLNKKLSQDAGDQLAEIDDAGRLADAIAAELTDQGRRQAGAADRARSRSSGWKWSSPSWRASSACCRSRRRSAAGSSARWRRPSANIISTSS